MNSSLRQVISHTVRKGEQQALITTNANAQRVVNLYNTVFVDYTALLRDQNIQAEKTISWGGELPGSVVFVYCQRAVLLSTSVAENCFLPCPPNWSLRHLDDSQTRWKNYNGSFLFERGCMPSLQQCCFERISPTICYNSPNSSNDGWRATV
jgi:hypothetical protein